MEANDCNVFKVMIAKLARLSHLGSDDRTAIRTLPVTVAELAANRPLIREGQAAGDCHLILDGYVCRYKLASNGGRQIVSFHMRGDVIDLQHMLFNTVDDSVQTITTVKYARFPASALRKMAQERPMVAEALWRDTLVDASISREWVMNVGRRDAKSRVAHLLCEFAMRRELAGLGSPERFELPMTQEQIGDATGLTAVHVNRMIRSLDEDGAIVRDHRSIHIADWKNMRQIADFDPMYLHGTAT